MCVSCLLVFVRAYAYIVVYTSMVSVCVCVCVDTCILHCMLVEDTTNGSLINEVRTTLQGSTLCLPVIFGRTFYKSYFKPFFLNFIDQLFSN